MDAVFTLRIRVGDDSDIAEIIERAVQVGELDEAWEEVLNASEDGLLPDEAVTVEQLEIVR